MFAKLETSEQSRPKRAVLTPNKLRMGGARQNWYHHGWYSCPLAGCSPLNFLQFFTFFYGLHEEHIWKTGRVSGKSMLGGFVSTAICKAQIKAKRRHNSCKHNKNIKIVLSDLEKLKHCSYVCICVLYFLHNFPKLFLVVSPTNFSVATSNI